MVNNALRFINQRIMFPRRYAFLAAELRPLLGEARSILDIGSSNGILIQQITSALPDCTVACVDVHVQPDAVLPIQKYDGTRLPFDDDSFDCAVLIDVLHHASDPVALLTEATRVARRQVVIKDHYFESRLDWWVLKLADLGGNTAHGIDVPCNYLDVPAWHAAFVRCGLTISIEKLVTKLSVDPCKHVIYRLQKRRDPAPSHSRAAAEMPPPPDHQVAN
jgi:SAM-dependent methyltransferase